MTDEQLAQEFFKGMMFERWLRFQFLEEREGGVFIVIPPDWLRHIAAEPGLLPVAQALDGRPANLAASRQALMDFFYAALAQTGKKGADPSQILQNPLIWHWNDHAASWLDLHADTLPRLEFNAWLALFYKWLEKQPS